MNLWGSVCRASARLVTIVVATAVVTLGTPGSALAHADLDRSDPAMGSTIGSLPDSIELTFTEPVARPAAVSVIGPDGTDLADGGPQVFDNLLRQPVKSADASPGEYSLNYQLVSADGHAVSGTARFVLRGTGRTSADPAAASASASEGGTATGLVSGLVVGLLLALGLAVFGVYRVVRGERDD